MSRGDGKIMRDLLVVLNAEDRFIDTFELARRVYQVQPDEEGMHWMNDAQLVAVRRALNRLAAQGKIVKRRGYHNGRAHWANERFAKAEMQRIADWDADFRARYHIHGH